MGCERALWDMLCGSRRGYYSGSCSFARGSGKCCRLYAGGRNGTCGRKPGGQRLRISGRLIHESPGIMGFRGGRVVSMVAMEDTQGLRQTALYALMGAVVSFGHFASQMVLEAYKAKVRG